MGTVPVGDVELAVTDLGDGPPVVLVHGFPELAWSWRHQLPALVDAGLRAIAYDQRGYGGSSKPEAVDAYRLDRLVGDLIGLLDALGLERAHLVGHDWGSIVVWATAILHPERVERVVSLNVPYRGWFCGFPTTDYIAEHLADRFGYVLTFQERGVTEARFAADPEAWLRRIYTSIAADPGFLGDEAFGVYLEAFRAGGLAGPLAYYRNIDANWALAAPHADEPLRASTLMVVADADPVLPSSLVEGMERWVPDLEVVAVERCGHWTQQERPDAVNRALVGFLAP